MESTRDLKLRFWITAILPSSGHRHRRRGAPERHRRHAHGLRFQREQLRDWSNRRYGHECVLHGKAGSVRKARGSCRQK